MTDPSQHGHAPGELARGWPSIVAGFVLAVYAWGLGFYGQSAFVAMLQQAYGWSAATVSSATTVYYLAGAAFLAFTGDVYRRLGSRGAALTGVALMFAGVWCLPRLDDPWQLFAANVVTAAGWALCSGTAVALIVTPWFERRRGLALALALTGASVAGFTFTPLLLWLHATRGFAQAVSALLPIAAATVVLVVMAGARAPAVPGPAPGTVPAASVGNAALLRSRHFWGVAGCFATGWVAQVGFLMLQVSLLTPLLGAAGTATALAATTISAVAGRLGLGALSDRMTPRTATALTFGIQIAGILVLWAGMREPATPLMLHLGCVLFGVSVGNAITLPPLLIQREWPSSDFARVVSLSASIGQLAFSFGPALLGWLRDVHGNWDVALAACVLLQATAVLLALGTAPPRSRSAR